MPILEPEVSITSPHKEQAETLLRDAIHKHVEALPADAMIMVKLTIPTQPGLYADLASDPRVLRVLALSGGYSRDEACALLVHDHAMIASFSRALLEGLTDGQTDDQFNAPPRRVDRRRSTRPRSTSSSVPSRLPSRFPEMFRLAHVCRGASSRLKPATKSSRDSGAVAGRTTNLLEPGVGERRDQVPRARPAVRDQRRRVGLGPAAPDRGGERVRQAAERDRQADPEVIGVHLPSRLVGGGVDDGDRLARPRPG